MASALKKFLSPWKPAAPAPAPLDDWALWQRAVQGDADSATALVRLLMPQALGLARQMLGCGGEAEDAVQESFLRLWRSRATDTGQARLATYFNTIVLNRCRTALVAARREQATDPQDLADLQEQDAAVMPASTTAGGGTAHAANTQAVRLRAAIDTLPARQRMALAMWTYADADVPTIAEALDIDANAAHQLLHRARRKLRDMLAPHTDRGELP